MSMQVKYTSETFSKATFVHLLGNDSSIPVHFPQELIDYSNTFLSSDDKQKSVKTIDCCYILVKHQEDAELLRKEGAKIIGAIKDVNEKIVVSGNSEGLYALLEGMALASYAFTKYFTDEKKRQGREEIFVSQEFSETNLNELNATISAVFWARDMVNEPVSYLTAEKFASEMSDLAKKTSLNVTILEKDQIESLKMGGLLAVNKGSIDPPTFTIMEYKPENPRNSKPIVLVGKGVVYDTGGLSLKPTPGSMDVMKSDMGGGAAMAGAIYLAALWKLDVHVIALIPATDNRPGLNAYTPGDIITMYDGTTVEVLNTDAEGRMILADALSYSKKYDPELVIDAATLTGAAVRAIGTHASIIMGNADQKYFDQLNSAGNATFDRVVQFPFWDEYFEEMKSKIADLKNIGGGNAGMISAGKFLEHFVKSPYIHMDIAGPAWLDSANTYNTQGGTGAGVRLLANFLKNYN